MVMALLQPEANKSCFTQILNAQRRKEGQRHPAFWSSFYVAKTKSESVIWLEILRYLFIFIAEYLPVSLHEDRLLEFSDYYYTFKKNDKLANNVSSTHEDLDIW